MNESLCAQKQAWNWYFGNYAGVNFSSGAPLALTNGALTTAEGVATISDTTGKLLFYTDGTTVYDATNGVMQNGDGLLGNSSSTESAIILQEPGSASLYYIFTIDCIASTGGNGYGLNYSIVDVSQNSGLGNIITKNVSVRPDATEKLTALKDKNGDGYWIVINDWDEDDIFSYHLTAAGLSATPVKSNVGPIHSHVEGYVQGYLRASRQNDKLALTTFFKHSIVLFDFDNSTGIASGRKDIQGDASTIDNVYGIEFSPNGNLLYAASIDNEDGYPPALLQFNLAAGSASDILNSGVVIAQHQPLANAGYHYYYGALQIAPDGKIYCANDFDTAMGVINLPDNIGTACNYANDVVSLKGRQCYLGLPNILESYLLPVDTIVVGSLTGSISACAGMASANPFIQQFTVSGNGSTAGITVTVSTGFEVSLAAGSGYASSILIPQPNGKLLNTTVYVRSAANAPVGNISGSVVLSSPGAKGDTLLVTGIVLGATIVDTSVTVCSGHTYTLPSGKIVNVTGNYSDTLKYSAGCDSVITNVNLSVLATKTLDTAVTICGGQSYTLPSGTVVNTPGVYNDTLRYIAGCDSLVTTVKLTVLSVKTVDTSTIICAGQKYTLPSGIIVNATGIYKDTLRHTTGCDSLITNINLTVLTAKTVDTSVTICAGENYTLPSGKKDSVTGVINDTLYYASGCDSLVTTLTLNVLPFIAPTVTITASADSVCAGTPVTFTAVATNTGNNPVYQWVVNGIIASGGGNTFTSSTLNSGDSVYCVITENTPCVVPSYSGAVYMTVSPLPSVTFSPDTVYILSAKGAQLAPIVTGAITKYEWLPGAGLSATNIASPVANPLNSTIYQLAVSTVQGCSDSATITVLPGLPLLMPNSFTPNGDGHNDVFRIPQGAQLTLGEFDIYNRWGNKIFSTQDISQAWDGTYNGFRCDTGTYVYVVTGKNLVGKPVFLKGTVVLLR